MSSYEASQSRPEWSNATVKEVLCPVDLLAMRPGQVLRVEVKTATRNYAGGWNWPGHTHADHDVLAAVTHDGEIRYYAPDNVTILDLTGAHGPEGHEDE